MPTKPKLYERCPHCCRKLRARPGRGSSKTICDGKCTEALELKKPRKPLPLALETVTTIRPRFCAACSHLCTEGDRTCGHPLIAARMYKMPAIDAKARGFCPLPTL